MREKWFEFGVERARIVCARSRTARERERERERFYYFYLILKKYRIYC